MLKLIKREYTLPILIATLFFISYSLHSINRHLTFNSHAFDLGIFTQITYLYSERLTPFSTLKHMILLGDHFEVILVFLSPLYKIFPSAITLLLLQALFVSLSSIPLFLISKDKLKNTKISLLLSLCYLTSVGIISAINFDFHPSTLSVLPLSLVLYFWYFRKYRLYWIFLLFSILFKEDTLIFLAGLGLYQIFRKQTKLGLVTFFISLVSFYVIKFIIMPFFWSSGSSAYISTSILPLNSPADLIYLFFIRPNLFLDIFINSSVKLNTFHTLLREFGYLPLISPLYWLTVFPHLYLRFSTTYSQSWTLIFHHNANIMPFLFMSSILTISNFKLPHKYAAILLLINLFLGGLSPYGFIYHNFRLEDPTRYYSLNKNFSLIPKGAYVSAQTIFVPHLANREKIYLFPEVYDAEYIVLDPKQSSYPIEPNLLNKKIAYLKKQPSWEVVSQDDSFIIFKKRKI